MKNNVLSDVEAPLATAPLITMEANGGLFFFAVGEVAGVAQARHDVEMRIQLRVDSAYPHCGGFGREMLAHIVDGRLRGNHRGDVHVLWSALGEQCFVCQLHR